MNRIFFQFIAGTVELGVFLFHLPLLLGFFPSYLDLNHIVIAVIGNAVDAAVGFTEVIFIFPCFAVGDFAKDHIPGAGHHRNVAGFGHGCAFGFGFQFEIEIEVGGGVHIARQFLGHAQLSRGTGEGVGDDAAIAGRGAFGIAVEIGDGIAFQRFFHYIINVVGIFRHHHIAFPVITGHIALEHAFKFPGPFIAVLHPGGSNVYRFRFGIGSGFAVEGQLHFVAARTIVGFIAHPFLGAADFHRVTIVCVTERNGIRILKVAITAAIRITRIGLIIFLVLETGSGNDLAAHLRHRNADGKSSSVKVKRISPPGGAIVFCHIILISFVHIVFGEFNGAEMTDTAVGDPDHGIAFGHGRSFRLCRQAESEGTVQIDGITMIISQKLLHRNGIFGSSNFLTMISKNVIFTGGDKILTDHRTGIVTGVQIHIRIGCHNMAHPGVRHALAIFHLPGKFFCIGQVKQNTGTDAVVFFRTHHLAAVHHKFRGTDCTGLGIIDQRLGLVRAVTDKVDASDIQRIAVFILIIHRYRGADGHVNGPEAGRHVGLGRNAGFHGQQIGSGFYSRLHRIKIHKIIGDVHRGMLIRCHSAVHNIGAEVFRNGILAAHIQRRGHRAAAAVCTAAFHRAFYIGRQTAGRISKAGAGSGQITLDQHTAHGMLAQIGVAKADGGKMTAQQCAQRIIGIDKLRAVIILVVKKRHIFGRFSSSCFFCQNRASQHHDQHHQESDQPQTLLLHV